MKALVIGGTSNLGKAICKTLRENDFEVFATFANNEIEAQEISERYGVTFYHLNVRNEQEIIRLFEMLPSIDLLVNNTGVFNVSRQENLTLNAFESVIQTNATGLFLCCKYAIPKLNKHGAITNITSINAIHPGFDQTAHYDGSKGFVSSYSRSLAVELGENQIRVNAIAPGLLESPYLEDSTNTMKKQFISRAIIKRTVKPQEIADTVLFLWKMEAITGEIISVDCGYLIG